MKKLVIILGFAGMCLTAGYAQESKTTIDQVKKEKGAHIEIKEGFDPVVFIDGKKYDADILKIIDVEKIKSMEVLKDEAALEKYDSPGVILITTKKDNEKAEPGIKTSQEKVKIDLNGETPVIIVDGEVKSKEYIDNLDPDNIFSVSVLKDEKSKKKYNTSSGVILIKTKTSVKK